MSRLKRQSPAATGLRNRNTFHNAANYTSPLRAQHLPRNWRERLPDAGLYYRLRVEKLSKPNATGWAQGRCPFHDDHNASLSVNVADARGGWRCFASCGGGDLVGFHMRITGNGFAEAVRDLIGSRA